MKAQSKIENLTSQGKHVCVGLDTDPEKIPRYFFDYPNPVLEFNKTVIENTSHLAAAYKINFAFYERFGASGFEIIEQTLDLIPENILTIADAKRGDIGNTSMMYASSVFDHFSFDSVTANPYMGYDSAKPFLDYKDKITFFLGLTSNKSSSDFQKVKLADGRHLYELVITTIDGWNSNRNCGVVFGATNEDDLNRSMNILKAKYILLPGIGAQSGNLRSVVNAFKNSLHTDYLINISRALIYCSNGNDFPDLLQRTISDYHSEINNS
ncbi:MAG: orotidine-5'-phosphate decarboxylase [Ignavibacteriales bacterium]|nr:orotidine-5'-phosphate decarboxylase [Ignavibacteriales bacterium]MCF8314918.1 orotidine-5'-phosphate decarboxylase [Ignavibacteriales bacterium]MCF8436133.1 orotidine-5'-phosphate decarboxylase [Ignavibacteriales bacterium]